MATQEQINKHSTDKMMFVLSSIAFIFGIVWVVLGDSNIKLVYAPLAFAFFLHSMISAEKSGIALGGAH